MRIFYIKSLMILFSLFCLCQTVQAQTEAAGQVMLASGKLEAKQPNQTLRVLKRGSAFYAADTLTTYANSQAQLRFTDGTLVSLRPNTVFKIDQYQFDSKQPGDKKAGAVEYTVSLIKGGFRSISGEIAKTDPNEYKINTKVATIGVRGTEFSLMLDSVGGLGAATYQGLIYLKNEAGYIEIGDGAEYGYAYVASNNQKPKGEPVLPTFMLNDPRISNFTGTTTRTSTSRNSICLQ